MQFAKLVNYIINSAHQIIAAVIAVIIFPEFVRITNTIYILLTCPGCTQARTDSWIYFGMEPGLLSNRCDKHWGV